MPCIIIRKDGGVMGKNLKGKELGKGLYQRKDGRYEARIFVRGTGKTFSIYGTNLQHLKKERNAYLANVSPGIAGYDPRISVSKWYEKWMLIYVVHSVKATTLSNYVNGFERVREYIGYMRLIEVRPTHILDMIKGLEEEGYARTTVIQSLSVVRQLFKKAYGGKMIPIDPVTDIKLPKEEPGEIPDEKIMQEQEDEKCLSIYDTHRFLESCKNTRYYELFFILLHTGLRIGEALALEWCDLDFKHEKLRVYKTLNRVTKYYDLKGNELPERYSTIQITTPKKSASNRKVPLTDAVIAAFMSWKEKQDRDKEKLGKNWGKPNILLKKYPGLIFTTSSGRSYLPSSAQTECRRIVGIVNKHEIALAEKENRAPNLMDVHPHIFRHTFVTRCIQSGMDAATVKKIAGHSDEKMTNYYTHIEEEHIDDEYELYIQKYGTET